MTEHQIDLEVSLLLTGLAGQDRHDQMRLVEKLWKDRAELMVAIEAFTRGRSLFPTLREALDKAKDE